MIAQAPTSLGQYLTATQFWGAKPYPHIEIRDFMSLYESVYEKPETKTQDALVHTAKYHGRGKVTMGLDHAKTLHTSALNRLSCSSFTRFITENLIGTSYYQHQFPLCSLLELNPESKHFIHHSKPGPADQYHLDGGQLRDKDGDEWFLVFNAIYYMTINWLPEWGGGTLLLDRKGNNIEKVVSYESNKLLLFMHDSFGWHGMEDIKCPEDTVREVIFLPYYTNLEGLKIVKAIASNHGVEFHKWRQWGQFKGMHKAWAHNTAQRIFRKLV